MSQIKDLPLEQLAVQWHINNIKIEKAEATLNRIFTKPTKADTIKLLKVTPVETIKDTLDESLERLDHIEYWMRNHTADLSIITKMNVTPRFSHFKRGEA
jgi:LEA14-like dessication related protein